MQGDATLSRVSPVGKGYYRVSRLSARGWGGGGGGVSSQGQPQVHTNPGKLSTGDQHPAIDDADLYLKYAEGNKTLDWHENTWQQNCVHVLWNILYMSFHFTTDSENQSFDETYLDETD